MTDAPTPAAITAVVLERSEKLQRPLDPRDAETLGAAVHKASVEHGVEAEVLLAVIETESGYKVVARSEKNCQGLMQLAPKTARAVAERIGIHIKTLASIETNVQLGAAYLKEMWTRYKRLDHALTAYNRGPGAFETRGFLVGAYAQQVIHRVGVLKTLFQKEKPRTGIPAGAIQQVRPGCYGSCKSPRFRR